MNWKKNLLSFLLGLSGVFMKAQNPVSFTSDQGLSSWKTAGKMCGFLRKAA